MAACGLGAKLRTPTLSLRIRQAPSQYSTLDFLVHAYNIAGKLSRAAKTKHIRINLAQWKFLDFQKLEGSIKWLLDEVKDLDGLEQDRCKLLARELYMVMKNAEILVQDWCSEDWMLKAMLRADNGFSAMLQCYEQHWCIYFLEVVLASIRNKCPMQDIPYWMIDRTDDFCKGPSFLKALEQDNERLLEKLRKTRHKLVYKTFWVNGKYRKFSISSHLLQRLEAETSKDDNQVRIYLPRMKGCNWNDLNDLPSNVNTLLGAGSFGVVHKASWLGLAAAVKVVSMEKETDFWNEAAPMMKLQHPRIVQLFYCSSGQRECHLWTELMGQSLGQLLKYRNPFAFTTSVDIMLQIAEGLEFLHQQGIAHRDLNLANVLMVPTKGLDWEEGFIRVKLSDYGLHKTKLCGSRNGALEHSRVRYWRAPEVFGLPKEVRDENAEKLFTHKADVYSFAMVCYELLTATEPFQDVSDNTELFRIIGMEGRRPELPVNCPLYLATFIKMCWHQHPDMRPSSSQVCCMLRSFKCLVMRSSVAEASIEETITASDIGNLFKKLGFKFFIEALKSCSIPVQTFLLWLTSSVKEVRKEPGFCEVAILVADLSANWVGPNHDFDHAAYWYKEAANQGVASAQWRLGMCYETGLGVPKDECQAFDLYKLAAEQGYPSAEVELGRCYSCGYGVQQSAQNALIYWERASAKQCSTGEPLHCIELLIRVLLEAPDEKDCNWACTRLKELVSKERVSRQLVAGPAFRNVESLTCALGDPHLDHFRQDWIKKILEKLALEDDIQLAIH